MVFAKSEAGTCKKSVKPSEIGGCGQKNRGCQFDFAGFIAKLGFVYFNNATKWLQIKMVEIQ